MSEQLTLNITYGILLIALGLMIWYIVKIARANRQEAIDESAPKIAGDDEIGGEAKNPEQFDEPDDDALDEMGAL
ncbi:MAG: hypothetical protein QF817_06605, partial [Candidatus Poseidoniaceae archaeon]|nr:hypothetical protein [Candidatus Poseidoniaceae archaeon]